MSLNHARARVTCLVGSWALALPLMEHHYHLPVEFVVLCGLLRLFHTFSVRIVLGFDCDQRNSLCGILAARWVRNEVLIRVVNVLSKRIRTIRVSAATDRNSDLEQATKCLHIPVWNTEHKMLDIIISVLSSCVRCLKPSAITFLKHKSMTASQITSQHHATSLASSLQVPMHKLCYA